jgi:3-isopropylmalate/(R)-2-methylmalate dehydratase small subunit
MSGPPSPATPARPATDAPGPPGAAGHRVWRLPDDVDTDQLAPGATMKHGIAITAQHCLATVRPDFAGGVRSGDVIVAGRNFGIGSSREQAAEVLRYMGVAAVVAPSFGGLYFRNAFNLGLLLLTCREAGRIGDGERIRFDAGAGWIERQEGERLDCEPTPAVMLALIRDGGLLPQLKRRLAAGGGADAATGSLRSPSATPPRHPRSTP